MSLTANGNVPETAIFIFRILQKYIVRKLLIPIFYGPKVSAGSDVPASRFHAFTFMLMLIVEI
jgi:hypothetical protein